MQGPLVTVIIPCRDDPVRLETCLLALEDQSYSNFEVIAIDSGSDPPLEIDPARVFYSLLTLREDRPGSYLARNRGIAIARGEIFCFTDADCLPDKDWIREGVFAMHKDSVGIVGGNIQVTASLHPNCYELLDLGTAFPQRAYIQKQGFGVTANLFVWREVVCKVGRFRPDLQSGGDREFGQRVVESSYAALYAPTAIVRHPARHTLAEHLEKWRRVGRGLVWLCPRRRDLWVLLCNTVLRAPYPPLRQWNQILKELRDRSKLSILCALALAWIGKEIISINRVRESIYAIRVSSSASR